MRGIALLISIVAVAFGSIAFSPSTTSHAAWGTQVLATYTCHYGKVTAQLMWTGTSPYAVEQWVDMSYTDNGWKWGTFTGAGPYNPKINTLSWDGLQPSTRHFLRFNQRFANGAWDPSLTFRFDTPSCGADGFTVTYDVFSFAGDYDCAGGEGNGPNYIEGPIHFRGADPYGLDEDGDGVGCE